MWLVQGSYLLPVDAGTGVMLAPIALGRTVDYQDTVAVGFGKVWLALNGLTRVDLDTYRVLAPIKKIPGLGTGIANSSGNGVVAGYRGVWTTASGGVARVNGLTGKLVEIIPMDGSFDYMAIGAGGVWVADKLAGTVTRIDPKTDTAGAPISIGGNIDGIAAGAGGVWVLDSAGTVTPIDSSTNVVRPQIRVGSDPVDITFGLAAVWVADQASGTIWRIDPDTQQVVSIKVGGPVAAVAVDRANHSLWAAVMPNQSSRVG
jgi:streptogramin lyase